MSERCACCGQPIEPATHNLHALEGFSPQERALLKRLGKRPATRDALIMVIWPDSEPSDAGNSLAQVICKVRSKLRKRNLPYGIVTAHCTSYRLKQLP